VTGPAFIANALCLDFVNLVAWRGTRRPHDHLRSCDDLADWSCRAGLISDAEAAALRRRAGRDPRWSGAVLGRARELREAIHALVGARAKGVPIDPKLLAVVNRALAARHGQQRLAKEGEAFVWHWPKRARGVEHVLWQLADSAGRTLIETERHRLKTCAGADCGWVFLDTSRNNTRRWCDMADCGNRQKARRHYEQVRKGQTKRDGAPRGGRGG
jgi:predicted RNA-binding Zn ribbon-like protein